LGAARKSKHELIEEIVGRLARRHSTAAVLFHHALAERLGLAPTDHKCLDLLRERGAMAGSDLAAITGLTSGAITGVVARLEQTGFLRREPDPHDGRRQILSPVSVRLGDVGHLLEPMRKDVALLLENFHTRQLTAIAEFLARMTDCVYHHAARLRAESLSAVSPTRVGKQHGPPPVRPIARRAE